MKKMSTKKALTMAALSIIVCFSMLLGTTFAWFTDSVVSGNNVIKTGSLNVELKHTNKVDTDETVTDTTVLFDDVQKWEPGAMVVEKFTVTNEGTLALKFKFSLNVESVATVGDNKKLTDVLTVSVFESEPSETDIINAQNPENLGEFELATDVPLESGEEDVFYVSIYWKPTENDNDYNVKGGALNANLGVTLLATQASVESDSFGTDYDKDATYPTVSSGTGGSGSGEPLPAPGVTFKDGSTKTWEQLKADGKVTDTEILDSAFEDDDNLVSIVIPEGVTSIGSNAFKDCKSLTTVTIPTSVKTIGSNAFNGCSSLVSVTIPTSVKTIGNYAFYGCSSLTTVTIPASVTAIGASAFRNCPSLTTVKYYGTAEPNVVGNILDNTEGITIQVPTNYAGDTFAEIPVSKVL